MSEPGHRRRGHHQEILGERTVVDGLDMQVQRGEIYGFLGPNGSGKTTFLRILCGLLRPDAGQRNLPADSTCMRQSDAIKRRVGYMTQKFSLYEDLSIAENLRFVADIYEMRNAKKAVGANAGNAGPGGPRPVNWRVSSPAAGNSGWPWPPA